MGDTNATVGREEIDQIVADVSPEAAFASHCPSFSVERVQIHAHHVGGPRVENWHAIRDGGRYVGLVGGTNQIDEGIRLFGFHPDALLDDLPTVKGRFHYEHHYFGPFIQTGMGGIPLDAPYEFEALGDRLRVRRRHGSRTNEFELSLDPCLGYGIAARVTTDSAAKPFPLGKAGSPGTFNVWPDLARFAVTSFTPDGREGYEGYYNSTPAISNARFQIKKQPGGYSVRDGGFIAFLNDRDGWGVCFSRRGGGTAAVTGVSDGHNVYHHAVNPERPTAVGQRLIGLPPAVSNALLSKTRLYMASERAVVVRFGREEDFEDQPVRLDAPVRGMYVDPRTAWLVTDPVTERKALAFEKEFRSDVAQVAMDANATYRLTARVKAEGGDAVVWAQARLYEWSPKHDEWHGESSSRKVHASEDWQDIALEISSSDWDPFVDLRFRCDGGRGLIDKMHFERIR